MGSYLDSLSPIVAMLTKAQRERDHGMGGRKTLGDVIDEQNRHIKAEVDRVKREGLIANRLEAELTDDLGKPPPTIPEFCRNECFLFADRLLGVKLSKLIHKHCQRGCFRYPQVARTTNEVEGCKYRKCPFWPHRMTGADD